MTDTLPAAKAAIRVRLLERYRALDGGILRRLTQYSLSWLRANQQIVNALNVFPIPDGDTGTNMVLTMQSAWEEVSKNPDSGVGSIAHSLAHGALMGARGNSGVILSQLWRGFARALEGMDDVDGPGIALALAEARDTAYRGVVRPVEGTILTVSKDIAAAAQAAVENGTISGLEVLERAVHAADESVRRTPDLLPVLREAGVVDSGGKGLYFILDGMLRAAYRLPLDQALDQLPPLDSIQLAALEEIIEPGQDWEVVVDFRPDSRFNLADFHQALEGMGTSIQIAEGDGLYRMHIHVPDQTEGAPVEYIRNLGTVVEYRVENLMVQAGRPASAPVEFPKVGPDDVAVVAVSPAKGLSRLFASLGVAAIVEGGQTMNPSAQELVEAIESIPARRVIILPNNKNIVLTAQQAVGLVEKEIFVVATNSVPQGLAAMLPYDRLADPEALVAAMDRSRLGIRTGELTTATRSVEIDGVAVQEGQILGLLDGRLAVSGDTLEEATLRLLEAAAASEAELLTLYTGADLPDALATQLTESILRAYPSLEIESHSGGQPHYPLLLSIE
ncbi:MAG TPA: DAK2 domain-containing protein [Anaerolineales bacterium]|nr:DAK2 domain-containing protein [Anaerolineales bacterium]